MSVAHCPWVAAMIVILFFNDQWRIAARQGRAGFEHLWGFASSEKDEMGCLRGCCWEGPRFHRPTMGGDKTEGLSVRNNDTSVEDPTLATWLGLGSRGAPGQGRVPLSHISIIGDGCGDMH